MALPWGKLSYHQVLSSPRARKYLQWVQGLQGARQLHHLDRVLGRTPHRYRHTYQQEGKQWI